MFDPCAMDPALLVLSRKGMTLPEPKLLQVFEHGRASWRHLRCKLGFHDWANIINDGLHKIDLIFFNLPEKFYGFNLDLCRRRCHVRRLWREWRRS